MPESKTKSEIPIGKVEDQVIDKPAPTMESARQPLAVAEASPGIGDVVENRVRYLSFGFFFLFVGWRKIWRTKFSGT